MLTEMLDHAGIAVRRRPARTKARHD